jgi:hypothetical protein
MDVSGSIEHAVTGYFTNWLGAHPYLAWMIAHPLPSFGLVLLIVFSLWGLIKAIGRGIEQIWLVLLTTPFRLLQPLLRVSWSSIRRLFGHNNNVEHNQLDSQLAQNSVSERIACITDRLQVINQEQAALLSELSTLSSPIAPNSKVDESSDTQYLNLYAKLPKFN